VPHTTIYFLTEAEEPGEAERRVSAYLETEIFFDYSGVLPEQSGPLEQKRDELIKFLNGWEWKETADGFLKEAEGYKDAGNLAMYGYSLIRAGELYSQNLTIDTHVFNIDTADYSIPTEAEGWQLTAVNFHY
jgi:hypothetical protein